MAPTIDAILGDRDHCAYCNGPSHLIYLLSALDSEGISPSRCVVFDTGWGVGKSELRSIMLHVLQELGMRVAEVSETPNKPQGRFTLKGAIGGRESLVDRSGPRRTFWYSKGTPFSRDVYDLILSIRPTTVYEYYHGYHSAVIWRAGLRLSPDSEKSLIPLKRFTRDLQVRQTKPDRYFIPGYPVGTDYWGEEVNEKKVAMPLETLHGKIRQVGEALEGWLPSDYLPPSKPHVLFLTTLFPGMEQLNPAKWQKYYNEVLTSIREVMPKGNLWIKAHPYTPPDHMVYLGSLATRCKAELFGAPQIAEYLFEKWQSRRVAVFGAPCTVLPNAYAMGYGGAFCPTFDLMDYYLGLAYKSFPHHAEEHDCMKAFGVKRFGNPKVLKQRLVDFLKGRD